MKLCFVVLCVALLILAIKNVGLLKRKVILYLLLLYLNVRCIQCLIHSQIIYSPQTSSMITEKNSFSHENKCDARILKNGGFIFLQHSNNNNKLITRCLVNKNSNYLNFRFCLNHKQEKVDSPFSHQKIN